jgi:CPA2 family monovalent cation:H+ antiporter-2
MRDAFAVLFFVSIGMLFQPTFMLERPILVIATLGIILLGKPLAAFVIVRLLRYPRTVALGVAVALAQIGEFSFILATLGRDLGILPAEASSTLIAAAIVSITLNPMLYRLLPRLERWLPPDRLGLSKLPKLPKKKLTRPRAVVVGWGPIGQTVTRLLQASDIEPIVIELNLDTVRNLRNRGIAAIYGDASRQEVLEEAGTDEANSLILTADAQSNRDEIVKLAHELNPKLLVIARCTYLKDVDGLRQSGAAAAFSGEGEVALAMTTFVLEQLGASPDQIGRERERLYRRLFAPATASTDS